jgi:hypothetical protein
MPGKVNPATAALAASLRKRRRDVLCLAIVCVSVTLLDASSIRRRDPDTACF